MKKILKITLKVILALVALVLVVVIAGALYLNSNFLSFDKKDKYKDVEIKELSINGYSFRDLNRNGELDIYEDDRKSLDERANDLLSQMTLDEKIRLLKGSGMKSGMGLGPANEGVRGAVGTILPVSRLGIPTLYLSDGPAGLRINPTRKNDDKTYYCTAFPIGTLLASTWNVDLVEQVGQAMGNEVLEYGIDVILGPGANIHRNPLCGRNFEYYSEDPIITGNIGAAMVNGIESNGVGTSVKHFVANNQETNRNSNDVLVSERALREIYLKGFEIIVKKSQPWTIMSSYNLVNRTYTSENRYLLTDIVRDDWGFEGIVMTDWFGGQNAPAQIHAGNDLLEPGTKKQYKALTKAAKNGELSMEDIDTSVKRILKMILKSKKMKQYAYSNTPDLKAHAEITRKSATEGIVLLKNNITLPLKTATNIALFGATSYDFIAGGTGSGDVNEAYTVSLEEGLSDAGFTINEDAKKAFEAHKAANKEAFTKPEGMLNAMIQKYSPPEMIPTETQLQHIVSSAEIAVITIGRNSGEGSDRVEENDFLLSNDEQNMISLVCETFHAANKKVIVVMNIGGVIETASWKAKPDAIVLAWQGGQESGNSVADILSGRENPSGKLPMTFPNKLADHASTKNFPVEGVPFNANGLLFGNKEKADNEKVSTIDYTNYEEGIYVGYRHFDKDNLEVSFPFGYGLSYTDFEFNSMKSAVNDNTIDVTVMVTNTGNVAGKEVVQLYVSKPDTQIDRPVQELKAFAKTPLLQSGETAEIKLSIPAADLSYWSETESKWILESGAYTLSAGASSRDKNLSTDISM
ncbi:glycoside hydrolase family 3 C-terminal domain-containing protein [uncultured Draconibacterium sp.]|uniref:glycoside hydrolase family 3 C-terminal domain-containing protein n=1 Tax=uncultured Draconibacterium sp. TaxID=1573823 RepID=UPI0032168A00